MILLVEDDERLAVLVKQFLEKNGFDVVVDDSGLNALRRARELEPDLVILDLCLPGRDGLSICKDLRPVYSGAILILTARDCSADQVYGLEYGADDYVVKPAEPRVLLARVRALLRRSLGVAANDPGIADPCVQLGELKVDRSNRHVQVSGKKVPLTSNEYELLSVLIERAGEILTRDFLFHAVYGREYDGLDRSIDVRMSQLRRKLGDKVDKPEKIKTVWGRGYLLVAEAW